MFEYGSIKKYNVLFRIQNHFTNKPKCSVGSGNYEETILSIVTEKVNIVEYK